MLGTFKICIIALCLSVTIYYIKKSKFKKKIKEKRFFFTFCIPQLTFALSFKSFMAGSCIGLPEANFVAFINSPSAAATSFTAFITITCESDCVEPSELAPFFTASASWTVM